MSTASLFLVTIITATLLLGTSHAGSPNRPSDTPPCGEMSQPDRKQSGEQRADRRTPGESDKGDQVSPAKAITQHAPTTQGRLNETPASNCCANNPSANVRGLRLLGPGKSVGAAKKVLIENKPSSRRNPPVQPPSAIAPAGPSRKTANKRGLAPAIIGGPANSAKDPAAINGTGMNRKP